MSLNFKILKREHVDEIRKRFTTEGYNEGLVTKQKDSSRAWAVLKMFTKKLPEPILTIRDYLCYLNLIQTYTLVEPCPGCTNETVHQVSKLLSKVPEILVIGFSENEEDQSEDKAKLDYKIDIEFDISPFMMSAQNKYELVTALTFERGPLGITSEVMYMKGSQGQWLRVDLFGMREIEESHLMTVSKPTMLVYQKKLSPDTERKNLESNFDLRDEFEGVELSPLPCFYMEQLKLLGMKPSIDLSAYLCIHDNLNPVYRDLYKENIEVQKIEDWELNILKKKRAVRPERKLCKSESIAFKRILLGTTLLPSPIVDFILEKSNSKEAAAIFQSAWKNESCPSCLKSLHDLKKRRTIEQYLFLKYDFSELSKKFKLPVEWSSQWYQYLFYDTDLFQDSSVFNNFPIPIHPELLSSKKLQSGESIQVNAAIWEIVRILYCGESRSLTAIGDEILSARDQILLERATSLDCTDHEIEELEKRVRGLVEVRLQKIEMESYSDIWTGAMGKSSSSLGDKSGKQKGFKKKADPPMKEGGAEKVQPILHEYFDSDSEKEEPKENIEQDSPELDEKRALSRIDEERSSQIQPSISKENSEGTQFAPSPKARFVNSNQSSAGKPPRKASLTIYPVTPSLKVNTADYLTTENAMKHYIQRHMRPKDPRMARTQSFHEKDNFTSAEVMAEEMTPKQENHRSIAEGKLSYLLSPSNRAIRRFCGDKISSLKMLKFPTVSQEIKEDIQAEVDPSPISQSIKNSNT